MEMRIWRGGSGCLPGAGMAVEQHPAATTPQPAPCAGPLGWQEGILGIITGILGVPSLCREVDEAGSPFGKALTAFPALDPALPGKRQGMWHTDGADSTPGIAGTAEPLRDAGGWSMEPPVPNPPSSELDPHSGGFGINIYLSAAANEASQ